jgi:ATP-binding cassette subfamily F protein uup
MLQNYSGTLFLVSHDREFLDNVVTQVIAFEGDGILREYVGGYEDWVRVKRESSLKSPPSPNPRTAKPPLEVSLDRSHEPPIRARLGYKETRELDELPEKIDVLEREQADITRELNSADIYRDNPEQARILQERYVVLEGELMDYLTRWEELEAKRAAGGQKV